jgi:molecular chaperone DnaJ
MTTQQSDFYAVLGLERNASPEDIKKAFRRLAMQYHPDRNNEPGAEERFKEINQAYEVLSDPEKRAAYDRFGLAGVNGAGGAGSLYVVIQVEPHAEFRRDEDDILYELPVNVAQATLGVEVSVPTVDGDAALSIPAGTQTGKVFVLRGKGVPHLRGGGRGDQLVRVQVVTPTHLTREQRRLFEELAASLGSASRPDEEHRDRTIFDKIRDKFAS